MEVSVPLLRYLAFICDNVLRGMPLNGEALRIEFVEDLVDGAPFVRVS
jgi:hypothetical protein